MKDPTSVRIASTFMVYVLMLFALLLTGGSMYRTFMHRDVAYVTMSRFMTITGSLAILVAFCFVFVLARLKEIETKLDEQ